METTRLVSMTTHKGHAIRVYKDSIRGGSAVYYGNIYKDDKLVHWVSVGEIKLSELLPTCKNWIDAINN